MENANEAPKGHEEQVPVRQFNVDGKHFLYELTNDNVAWRCDTILTKEPDTLHWIMQFEPDDIYVDIGANIGIYTIFAAAVRGVRTYAFEPEAQNFAALNRNIIYNNLHEKVTAFPIALSDEYSVNKLYLTQPIAGGSCHTFGSSTDFHLKERKQGYTQGSVACALDQLVNEGVIQVPNHIKIDVDGLEHLVLEGAQNTLLDPSLKSVLVEINTGLKEHQDVITKMQELGFRYEQKQVEVAVRTDGPFEGVGNFIFLRDVDINFDGLVKPQAAPGTPLPDHKIKNDNDVIKHIVTKLTTVDVDNKPYEHFSFQEFFPPEFYKELLENKPTNEELQAMNETGRTTGGAYQNRLILEVMNDNAVMKLPRDKRNFMFRLRNILTDNNVVKAFVDAFDIELKEGLLDLLFMRDQKGFRIGPHTDIDQRYMSAMIYIPSDENHISLGTSLYQPKQDAVIQDVTMHHNKEQTKRDFEIVSTACYVPNSIFAFKRSENSFHGCEELLSEYDRDTLCFVVRKPRPKVEAA